MPSERGDVEQYWLIRRAVRDGIWDVIETVLTVLVAGFLLFFGFAVLVQGLTDVGTRGPLPAVVGAVLVVAAVVVVLREFRLWPFD